MLHHMLHNRLTLPGSARDSPLKPRRFQYRCHVRMDIESALEVRPALTLSPTDQAETHD
jgi:hypothetical protein